MIKQSGGEEGQGGLKWQIPGPSHGGHVADSDASPFQGARDKLTLTVCVSIFIIMFFIVLLSASRLGGRLERFRSCCSV